MHGMTAANERPEQLPLALGHVRNLLVRDNLC